MKTKWIAALLCTALFAAMLIPAAGAAVNANDNLTLDGVVQINERQLVLEFSAPVAVNMHRQNHGPFMALRVVDDNQDLQWDGEIGTGIPMHYDGYWDFVDNARDRIIWTFNPNNIFGTRTIDEVLNFEGVLADWSHFRIMFCVEEIPYNGSEGAGNGTINNVTTLDGAVELKASRVKPGWWDGVYIDIERDFNYDLSQGDRPDAPRPHDGIPTMALADPPGQSRIIIYIVGGTFAAIAAGIAVLTVLSIRRRKESKY